LKAGSLCSNPISDTNYFTNPISLEPFTEEEARQYLNRKEITNPQVIDVILRLSGRLPLLVATLAAEKAPPIPLKLVIQAEQP
jgi:hypothetical protein